MDRRSREHHPSLTMARRIWPLAMLLRYLLAAAHISSAIAHGHLMDPNRPPDGRHHRCCRPLLLRVLALPKLSPRQGHCFGLSR